MNYLYFWQGHRNFGDELSLYLVNKITEKNFSPANPPFNKTTISAIGSIITTKSLSKNLIIWGSGTLKEDVLKPTPLRLFPISRFTKGLKENFFREHPDVRAVRGPRTKQLLDNIGVKCPTIFGDPAILTPLFYTPKQIQNPYKVGLILHQSQTNPLNQSQAESIGIRIISIERESPKEIEAFIDEVCSCDLIFSSSLHGIIIAQAYKIPAQWIQLPEQPIEDHNYHKFEDYFLGAGQTLQHPLAIDFTNESLTLLKKNRPPKILPFSRAKELYSAFPFDAVE